jgi:hypothetical protein
VERLVTSAMPLERHVYVVVPAPTFARTCPHPRHPWQRAHTQPSFQEATEPASDEVLSQRCRAIEASLRPLDVRVQRLESRDLATLWYGCLCPRLSRVQPLSPDALAALALPLVMARHRKEAHRDAPTA